MAILESFAMFDKITEKFDIVFRSLRGLGKITEANIHGTVRDIRIILLEADVNYIIVKTFIEKVKYRAEGTKVIKSIKPGEQFIKIIHDELITLLGGEVSPLVTGKNKPNVILLAGLQGSGKTTTAVKIAMHLKNKGFTSLLAAADVYRPAAIEQLITLGKQVGIPVFSLGKSDPVIICQEAVAEADSLGLDYVILDTAGRLHVDGEMMEEIQSIQEKTHPDETLFVVDGMTGQDAVNSAKIFSETLSLTGTILTKMEGDSRGGAAVSVPEVTGVPIKFLGVSEKIDGFMAYYSGFSYNVIKRHPINWNINALIGSCGGGAMNTSGGLSYLLETGIDCNINKNTISINTGHNRSYSGSFESNYIQCGFKYNFESTIGIPNILKHK